MLVVVVACGRVPALVRAWDRALTWGRMQALARGQARACVQVQVRACVQVLVRVLALTRGRVRACVHVLVPACGRVLAQNAAAARGPAPVQFRRTHVGRERLASLNRQQQAPLRPGQ